MRLDDYIFEYLGEVFDHMTAKAHRKITVRDLLTLSWKQNQPSGNPARSLLSMKTWEERSGVYMNRVVSRRIIETNRYGIFTRDMETIHIFHIPRLFCLVEV